jgi:hypothetical protein
MRRLQVLVRGKKSDNLQKLMFGTGGLVGGVPKDRTPEDLVTQNMQSLETLTHVI